MADLETLEKRVYDLQENVGKVNLLVTRFDTVIEKLSTVSQDISKLLAVQATRLEVQEKVGTSLTSHMEKRRDEVNADLQNLNKKIDDNEKELSSKMDKLSEKMDSQNADLKKHLTNIHKWIYVVTGGGMVVGFLISQILPKLL